MQRLVIRNMEEKIARLRDAGAIVEEISLDWDESLERAVEDHLIHIFATSITPALEKSTLMTDYARAFAEQSLDAKAETFVKSLCKAGEVGISFAQAMVGFDAFICPTTALPSIPADFNPISDEILINGKKRSSFLGWAMTPPFNMLSSHPVLSVPSGLASSGIPTGVQIVGNPYDDDMVFRIGLFLEENAK